MDNDRIKRMLLAAVGFVATWNICKFAVRNFATHDYSFSPINDIVIPLVVSFAVDFIMTRTRDQQGGRNDNL